jgi:hypothetical protein
VLGRASKLVLFVKYNSSDQVKEDEVGSACISHGREEECIQTCGVKARRKEPLGTPRNRWEDNIEMHLRDKG